MKYDYFSYTIGSNFIHALIHDDYSDLDDSEKKKLNDWIDDIEVRGGYFEVQDDGEFWGIDELSGYFNQCCLVNYYFPQH